nr:hypothetical protein GCM10025732_12230 [Glycomyces mayteni]
MLAFGEVLAEDDGQGAFELRAVGGDEVAARVDYVHGDGGLREGGEGEEPGAEGGGPGGRGQARGAPGPGEGAFMAVFQTGVRGQSPVGCHSRGLDDY